PLRQPRLPARLLRHARPRLVPCAGHRRRDHRLPRRRLPSAATQTRAERAARPAHLRAAARNQRRPPTLLMLLWRLRAALAREREHRVQLDRVRSDAPLAVVEVEEPNADYGRRPRQGDEEPRARPAASADEARAGSRSAPGANQLRALRVSRSTR